MNHARREPCSPEELPGPRALLIASLCIAAAHALAGASTLAILATFGEAGIGDAAFVTGASALAGVVGVVASITPAGLGFREGALTATLGVRFLAGPAALASVLTRGVAVLADAALLGAAVGYDHARGGRLRARLLHGADATMSAHSSSTSGEAAAGEKPVW